MFYYKNILLNEMARFLENDLCSLGIFNLSLDSAIIHLFRIFENEVRIPILAAMARNESFNKAIDSSHFEARRGMDALSILLPLIYNKCSVSKKISLNYNEKNYYLAGVAMESAYAYSNLHDAINLSYLGVFRPIKKQEGIYFFPEANSMNYDARAQIISFDYINSGIDNDYLYKNSLMDLLSQYLGDNIQALIKKKSSGGFLYKIPESVSKELDKMVKNIFVSRWILPGSVRLENYAVDEARRVWASLTKICTFHSVVVLYSGLPGMGMEFLPIIMEKKDLIDFLALDSGVSKTNVSNVVSDLIFNQNVITNEIMFQPFLSESNKNLIFFSPHIILFSNPERNLMKLWAKRYPGLYGAKIANEGKNEEKKLAAEIKKSGKNFKVVNTKKLKIKGKDFTDIDIAVYDEMHQEALFIELKWSIPPDSVREVRDNDEKLNEGMKQIKKIEDYLREQPNAYKDIFGTKKLIPRKVYKCIINSSNVGSFWVRKEYDIFNSHLIFRSLVNKNFHSISDMYKDWMVTHTFTPQLDYRSVFQIMRSGKNKYFLPATEKLDNRNLFLKILRYFLYFFLELLMGNPYFLWKKIEIPNIFSKNLK